MTATRQFRVLAIDLFERGVVLRLPFRFGVATLKACPQAFARARIAIRPVHNPLPDELRIRHDDRDPIVCSNYSRAQVNTLHVAFIFTNGDAISDSDRPFEKQNEARCNIGGDVLKSKTDAD